MLNLSKRILVLLLAIILALSASVTALAGPYDYNKNTPGNLQPDHLYGETAVLLDGYTGDILFSKNARVRMYPASTTKIMTALLALESGISLDTVITVPQEAAQIAGDSSLVPIYPGETMTLRDLLYGMLLHSGNDAANAVAVLVGGSIPNFVNRMNARAAELGCEGTHFANAHGYHDDQHYSTAYDLALIAREALSYPAFRDMVSASSYTMHVTPRGEIPLSNTNVMLRTGSSYYYEGCIGVKTGSTRKAGNCFVGAAERDGVMLISVTMNTPFDDLIPRWVDTIRLFDYGFTCYSEYSLAQLFELTGSRLETVRVSNAISSDPLGGLLSLDIAQISDPTFNRKINAGSELAMNRALDDFFSRCSIRITDNLSAPISKGEIVGSYAYYAANGDVVTASLIAGRDIEAEPVRMTIYDILPFLKIFSNPLIDLLLLVVLLLAIVVPMRAAARRRRMRHRRRELYERRRRAMQSRGGQPVRRPPQGVNPRERRRRDDDLFGDF